MTGWDDINESGTCTGHVHPANGYASGFPAGAPNENGDTQ